MTPEILEAAYELLRATPPFSKWKLSHPDDLIFAVDVDRSCHAKFDCWTDGTRKITVSAHYIKGTQELLPTMAHEMVHLRQELTKHNDHHGPWFQKWSKQVCDAHGWNLATF